MNNRKKCFGSPTIIHFNRKKCSGSPTNNYTFQETYFETNMFCIPVAELLTYAAVVPARGTLQKLIIIDLIKIDSILLKNPT